MLGNRIIVKILRNETFETTTVRGVYNTGETTQIIINLAQYGVIDSEKMTVKVNNTPTLNYSFEASKKILTIDKLLVGTEYQIELIFPCYQTGSVIMEGYSLNLSEEYETADSTIFGDEFERLELTIKRTTFTFEAYKENPIVKKMWNQKKPVVVEIYGDLEDEYPEDIVKGYVKKIERKIDVKDVNKISYEFTSAE